ncbi:MAG TPA: hypothetical protein VFZ21_31035 [Gemmatimonadaceae bacterium]|nr:hypothetical protein [Gemmatimonadaceae bacterium]
MANRKRRVPRKLAGARAELDKAITEYTDHYWQDDENHKTGNREGPEREALQVEIDAYVRACGGAP